LTEKLRLSTGCDEVGLKRLFDLDMLYPVETGSITGKEFFQRDVSRVLPGFTYEQWVDAFTDHYTVNPVGFNLLSFLKESGRRVFILSNLADYHKEAIERKIPGIFCVCDKNYFSYEIGMHKPEIGIFRRVCENIGEDPGSCVFFDDLAQNVEGAEHAGMIGIQFSNDRIAQIFEEISRLETDLTSFNISSEVLL
jgi:FMN phosphatase YigB (HAD superfamily)